MGNKSKEAAMAENTSDSSKTGSGTAILRINRLSARVEETEILHGVNLNVKAGETHVLMGPNGAGKSTLGYVLMGNPQYSVTGGKILFNGKDITDEPADRRAKDGMFLSFQEPLEVPGLSLESFIRSAVEQKTGGHTRLWDFRKELFAAMDVLQMDHSYAQRSLNVGFSGGEKKKAEILQLMMLKPELAILDETDSGLDVDAVRLVSKGIEEYRRQQTGALLIITHSTRILESLQVDYTHVMVNGSIVYTGDGSVVDTINRSGYEQFTVMKK
jgi:Fe-S cluster assembly ATP-binding protein